MDGVVPAPMTADYDEVVAAGHTWVATIDDQVVAVLVLKLEPDHLLVDNIAVDPARHGTGIGSELMQFAAEEARHMGVGEIRLYTHQTMTENLAFYARRGYRETHRETDDGFARVFFSKRLI
jgi:ribosomal protein S18 acetylase RimI-like enzyme